MNELRTVTVPVGDWLIIDATIDNTVAIAAQDGDDATVTTGDRVREAGWAVARAHPRNGDGPAGWPPADADLTVALPMGDWSFVLGELASWAAVSQSIGQTDEYDESVRVEGDLRATLNAPA